MTPADAILAEEQAELAASYAMYLREIGRARARVQRRYEEIRRRASAKLAELGRAAKEGAK